jgi:hypothetical protein
MTRRCSRSELRGARPVRRSVSRAITIDTAERGGNYSGGFASVANAVNQASAEGAGESYRCAAELKIASLAEIRL